MLVFSFLLGLFFVLSVLLDSFETIILPRTVKRSLRLTRLFFYAAWLAYSKVGRMKKGAIRQGLLAAFAPSMLILLISLWATLMIIGFALIHYGLGSTMKGTGETPSFSNYFYFSGVTFFTLGFGDVTPLNQPGRSLAVLEAGMGFGLLALVISYIPVLYTAFSTREMTMLLLDSKAGSEPTAAELLRRHAAAGVPEALIDLLKDWEIFCARLLESYLSYPILAFYRSQHDDQSWLCSLTAVMDACALLDLGLEDDGPMEKRILFQSRCTFAMARHLIVDLAYILDADPFALKSPRLDSDKLNSILEELDIAGMRMKRDQSALQRLSAIRNLYEPYVAGLANDLVMDLPEWIPSHRVLDNWQTSAWDGDHF